MTGRSRLWCAGVAISCAVRKWNRKRYVFVVSFLGLRCSIIYEWKMYKSSWRLPSSLFARCWAALSSSFFSACGRQTATTTTITKIDKCNAACRVQIGWVLCRVKSWSREVASHHCRCRLTGQCRLFDRFKCTDSLPSSFFWNIFFQIGNQNGGGNVDLAQRQRFD